MASLMLSRLHSLVDARLAFIVILLFLNTHFHVLSPQHALPRAAGGLLVLQRRTHPFRALRV